MTLPDMILRDSGFERKDLVSTMLNRNAWNKTIAQRIDIGRAKS